MAMRIAISGKGGTGKTTLSALMIRCLVEQQGQGAVLAVDADANACLGMMLGVESAATVADLREDALKQEAKRGGMGKLEAFEFGCHELLTEAKGFDLLAMGRPEGPKCYCAVNHVLRRFLDELTPSYGYTVTDNEAGMEHLSRRTTNDVDWLIIVGEATAIGEITAKRIIKLAGSLPIKVNNIGIVWNRTESGPAIDGAGVLGCIPNDQAIVEAAVQDKTVFDLDANSPALSAVRNMLQEKLDIK